MFPFGRSVTTPTEVRATRAMGWVRVERRLLAGRRVLLLHLLARLGEHPFDGIRLPGGTLAIGCSRDRVFLDESADAGERDGEVRVAVEAVQLEQLRPLLPEELLHNAARVVPRLFESRAAALRVGLERLQIRVALGGDGRFDGLHVPILRAEREIDQGLRPFLRRELLVGHDRSELVEHLLVDLDAVAQLDLDLRGSSRRGGWLRRLGGLRGRGRYCAGCRCSRRWSASGGRSRGGGRGRRRGCSRSGRGLGDWVHLRLLWCLLDHLQLAVEVHLLGQHPNEELRSHHLQNDAQLDPHRSAPFGIVLRPRVTGIKGRGHRCAPLRMVDEHHRDAPAVRLVHRLRKVDAELVPVLLLRPVETLPPLLGEERRPDVDLVAHCDRPPACACALPPNTCRSCCSFSGSVSDNCFSAGAPFAIASPCCAPCCACARCCRICATCSSVRRSFGFVPSLSALSSRMASTFNLSSASTRPAAAMFAALAMSRSFAVMPSVFCAETSEFWNSGWSSWG